MSVHARGHKWVVRYRDGSRNRAQTFDTREEAEARDAEIRDALAHARVEAAREALRRLER